MNEKCIFCRIVSGATEEKILYADGSVVVVKDINPRTPTHLLIVTREHYDNYSQLAEKNPDLIGHMGEVVEKMVEQLGLRDKSRYGYTWGFHCGGKESVAHVHAQLLAEMDENELVL